MRPDIYSFHEYRGFLRELFAYRKASDSAFSLRALSRQAQLASGYLPMVMAGTRALSAKALAKLVKPLGLSSSEAAYLELLRTVEEADSPATRTRALGRLQKFRAYRAINPKEIEVYRYLTHWYYVAIREMAAVKDFRADAAWIQARLRDTVSLKEIDVALKFLFDHGYLERTPDGGARLPEKDLKCVGGVFRIALGQFHREMLTLAAASLENATSDERQVTGHTVAIPQERFAEARQILDDALKAIADLGRAPGGTAAPDSVYHFSFIGFPLTKRRDK